MTHSMLISVVTAVHNGEEYLEESIRSILAQTYRNWEWIIVNDGSTDRTGHILDSICDSRVRVIHLNQNKGAAYSLNLAVEHARGEWLAIHDADDISIAERLEIQAAYVRAHPGLAAVGSLIRSISGNDGVPEPMLDSKDQYFNAYTTWEQINQIKYRRCPLCHGSALISKEKFERAGRYNPEYKIAYDYDMWLRLFDCGPVEKVPFVLYEYRVHMASLSHSDSGRTDEEKIRIALRMLGRQARSGKCPDIPRFTVLGSSAKCEKLQKIITPDIGIRIHKYIDTGHLAERADLYRSFVNGEIDGIILLHFPHAQKTFRYLEQKGMEPNKSLFRL